MRRAGAETAAGARPRGGTVGLPVSGKEPQIEVMRRRPQYAVRCPPSNASVSVSVAVSVSEWGSKSGSGFGCGSGPFAQLVLLDYANATNFTRATHLIERS